MTGVGPGESSAHVGWRGWRVCGALRLCVGHSSSVSKEREKSLLISKIACWLLRVRSKELNLRRFGHS